jgi:hypothetical protein
MVFELAFVFMLFSRRARTFAVCTGFLFHTLAHLSMGVLFWALQATYAVFVDWESLCKRWCPRLVPQSFDGFNKNQDPFKTEDHLPMVAVCTFLVSAMVFLGSTNKQHAWPLSSYPVFNIAPGAEFPAFTVAAFDRAGHQIPFDLNREMRPLYPHLGFSFISPILSPDNGVARQKYCRGLWETIRRQVPAASSAQRVRFYRTTYHRPPNADYWVPQNNELIWELVSDKPAG